MNCVRMPRCVQAVALLAVLAGWGATADSSPIDSQAPPAAPQATAPKASGKMQQEIRELAPLLESDDLAARQATAERIIAMGEAALPVFEDEMRRRKMAPNGQVKLVLLRLRSLREERLWTASIERLASAPRQMTLALREGDGPAGKVTMRSEPASGGSISLDVTIEPARSAQRSGSRTGDASLPRRVRATLLRDRTLSPQSVEIVDGQRTSAKLSVADKRLKGSVCLSTGGSAAGSPPGSTREQAVDVSAPPPLALDWALPLMVEVMPRVPETELVFTLVVAAEGSTQGLCALRCLGEQHVRVDGRERAVTAFELRGVEGSGAASLPVRRFEIDDRGRILRAELGQGRTLEDGSVPRK